MEKTAPAQAKVRRQEGLTGQGNREAAGQPWRGEALRAGRGPRLVVQGLMGQAKGRNSGRQTRVKTRYPLTARVGPVSPTSLPVSQEEDGGRARGPWCSRERRGALIVPTVGGGGRDCVWHRAPQPEAPRHTARKEQSWGPHQRPCDGGPPASPPHGRAPGARGLTPLCTRMHSLNSARLPFPAPSSLGRPTPAKEAACHLVSCPRPPPPRTHKLILCLLVPFTHPN